MYVRMLPLAAEPAWPAGAPTRRTAGCTLSGDLAFEPAAEVHVPASCAAHAASPLQGCMDLGAINFDETARQPTRCRYRLRGCTSPSALNYNSEASEDDGGCIEPVYGCTVRDEGYAGVDPATPFYQSRAVGVPLRGAGEVAWPAYRSVLNYEPAANSLRGCVVAIEGCMDPTAVNYDALATVDSNEWCVPRRAGCMMPASTVALPLNFEGLPLNFDPSVTAHDPAACVLRVRGCTSPTALNYRPLATEEDGSCYEPVDGCH